MNDVPVAFEDARSITATLRVPRPGERLAPLPSGFTLSVLEGPDEGAHAVAKDDVNVGRGQLCDIRLSDASISELHFKLSLGDGELLLEDLGSRNGVWIGRARIQRASLLPGAVFRAGACRFRLDDITTTSTAVTDSDCFYGVWAVSPAMRALFSLLARVAKTPLPILITGETGCGKGMVARAIHRASGRQGNFVTLDCTALPRDMAEAVVLGHMKGSFTGAHRDHPSPFEEADGGTLFLDEIGELPVDLQSKLLRIVDERVVQRVGSNHPRTVDVRILAATHRNLAQLVSVAQFRLDLYHRLSDLTVRIPPLRSRRDDVRHLAERFLDALAKEVGRDLAFTSEAIAVLESCDWPGNVRELWRVVRRAAYLADDHSVDGSDLFVGDEEPRRVVDVERPAGSSETDDRDAGLPPLKHVLDEARRDYCAKLLASTGSFMEAASVAGYSPRGLRMLLHRLRMVPP